MLCVFSQPAFRRQSVNSALVQRVVQMGEQEVVLAPAQADRVVVVNVDVARYAT